MFPVELLLILGSVSCYIFSPTSKTTDWMWPAPSHQLIKWWCDHCQLEQSTMINSGMGYKTIQVCITLSGAPNRLFLQNCVETSKVMFCYKTYNLQCIVENKLFFSNICSSPTSQLPQNSPQFKCIIIWNLLIYHRWYHIGLVQKVLSWL